LPSKVGYPVMIKAVAGGGGRGHAHRPTTTSASSQGFNVARMEAEKAFGNGAVYIER
jgi:acetyl-CoA carboxylase biotin carboxylase subunit